MLINKSKLVGLVLGLVLFSGALIHGATTPVYAQTQGSSVSALEYAEQQRQSQQTVITLHLAQELADPTLITIELGGNKALYALPDPVLTQLDMTQITPITAPDGRTFILFDLTPWGRERLASVSSQARGHYFLLSAKGQLINVAKISEPITDGKLLISTNGVAHTRQIIQLLQ